MGTSSRMRPPASILVWTINDSVIESTPVLEEQFEDIRAAGFGGVAAFVRCSRYSWDDEPARDTLRHIGRLCKRHHMDCWLGPDPRFISHCLVQRGQGLEVIMFGDQSRAHVAPHTAAVSNGTYVLRCAIPPRHVHTLTDVAISYNPIGLLRLYAFRAVPVSSGDIIDITDEAGFFYNARDGYVEAFGRFVAPKEGNWNVLGFFRFKTNHVDFSDFRQIRAYLEKLRRLKQESIAMDALMWDEAGFTCTYGTLPFTTVIRRMFKVRNGSPIETGLWKLALDAADGSHAALRNLYYCLVQELLNDAQIETNRQARRLWGTKVIAGIHDTWHFESADMCDMNHGSLDLWRAMKTKSGGFVDLGGIDQLNDPQSPYYANLAAMSVIASSLGRWSEKRFAMNNLWTVGDDAGEGWQTAVMDHCVNTMALFGTRWLAHAYGPVGTVGQEQSFLGSPPLPGYPDHSTWKEFPNWNRFLADHISLVENHLPETHLLLIYPVESLYAQADQRADAAAVQIFRLILALLDSHYHVEVLSPCMLTKAKWTSAGLKVGNRKYERVIYPHATVVPQKLLRLLRGHEERVHYAFASPAWDDAGGTYDPHNGEVVWTCEEAIALLAPQTLLRPVEAPPHSWVTITRVRAGIVVCLTPSRHGYRYEGRVSYAGKSVELEMQKGLACILFPKKGEPRILHSSTSRTVSA